MAADLHSEYGIDIESGIMVERSWPWLRLRVEALLEVPSRTARALLPRPAQPAGGRRRTR